MKLIKTVFEGVDDGVGLLIAGLITVAILLVIGIVIGMIEYWLLGIAFPEYVTFGWHWWRFLALGLLSIVFV